METFLPGVVSSYSEMQWRERQFTLSFTIVSTKQKTKENNLSEINKIVKEIIKDKN
jgi:hypothetical protein